MNPRAKPRPKTKAKRKPARRQQKGLFTWQRLRLTGFGLAVVTLIGGTTWLSIDGWFARQAEAARQALYAFTVDGGLGVADVMVVGRKRTPAEQILETIGVERGYPMMAFDPQSARARLESLPWVRSAAVERRFPRDIYVRLEEREPLAIWQNNGVLAVIDQAGDVIPDIKAQRFADLQLVVGPDAPEHTAALLALLEKEPELRDRVTAAVRVSGRRWNLKLKGGIDVQLPEIGAADAWSQLARIEREQGVLERDVVVIDLRLPDRLVVRTNTMVKPRRKPSSKGENT